MLRLLEHRSPVRLFRVRVPGVDEIWLVILVVGKGIRLGCADLLDQLHRVLHLGRSLVFIVVSLAIYRGVVRSCRDSHSQGLVVLSRQGHQ